MNIKEKLTKLNLGTKLRNLKTTLTQQDKKTYKRAGLILGAILLMALIGYGVRGTVVVASVNGSPIYRTELISSLESQYGPTALDNLVVQKLILQEAAKRGVVASDEDVKATVDNIRAELSAQGLTLEQALELQQMTLPDLIKQLRISAVLEKMVSDKVSVTDEEVDTYLAENEELYADVEDKESLRTNIFQFLREQKVNAETSNLIAELRASAKIENYKYTNTNVPAAQ